MTYMQEEIYFPADELEGATAVLLQWLAAAGETVAKDQPIAELETDKINLELAAPESGILTEILVKPGDTVDSHTLMARISTLPPPGKSRSQRVSKDKTQELRLITSPAVRRLLRENQLELEEIVGSGRGGRVTRKDVLAFLERPAVSQRLQRAQSGSTASHRVPHSNMRQRIASHMVQSLLHTAPHVTSVWQMDMTNVVAHRRWHKKEFQEQGVNLTYSAYFLMAATKALLAVPETNARFHADALELFDEIHIGVATALDNEGLVVPVVHSTQSKNLLDIARILTDQTHRARAGKLTPGELKNGTFTLSNHGVSGSLVAVPIIINQPQVAILGIGKLEKRAVVVAAEGEDDRIVIRPMCYVTLTIDHRALDGHQTNQWLGIFTESIEHWGE